MTTLTRIIVATLLSLSLFSCNFDMNFNLGVKGNGHVKIEERAIDKSFTAIHASEGLNVYLTQGSNEGITVKADENLLPIIITEVVNNVLKIHCEKNIGKSSAKKVMIRFKDISKIVSTSGSDVYSTNLISTEELELKSTSGSNMKVDVQTLVLICKSTSGSDLKISGKTDKLIAEATSGSDIKARYLMTQSSQVKASSGADITVNTEKELIAKATSGGDITYYGNPKKVDKSGGVSGSIRKH